MNETRKYEYTNEKGDILCQECGKPFQIINPSHTKNFHGMELKEYMEKYPDAPLRSVASRKRLSNSLKRDKSEIFKSSDKDETVKEIINDNSTHEDIITDMDNESEIEEKLFEKKKQEIEELMELKNDLEYKQSNSYTEDDDFDPYNSTPKPKLNLLRNLKMIFPNIKNNYSIEKTTVLGHLEYKFITDMADPVRKVILEFPNTFWRNIDNPPNHMKYDLLKRDGWKIITIPEVGPDMKTIEKYIDFVNN